MTLVKPRINNKTLMENTQSNDKDNDKDDVPLTYLETIHFNKYMVTSEQDTLVGLQYVNSRDWDDDDDDDDLSTTDVDDDDLSTTDVDDVDDDDETNHQHRNSNDDEGEEDFKLLDDTTTTTTAQPTESTIIMEMNTPANIPSTTLPSTNHEEEGVLQLPTKVTHRSQSSSSSSSTPCWNEPHVLPTNEEEEEDNMKHCQFPKQQSKLMGMEFHILWSSLQGLSFS